MTLLSPNPREREDTVRRVLCRRLADAGMSEAELARRLGRTKSRMHQMLEEDGAAALKLADLLVIEQAVPGILAELAHAAGYRLVPLTAATNAVDVQHAVTAAQVDAIAATAAVINAAADGTIDRHERAACRPLIRRATAFTGRR